MHLHSNYDCILWYYRLRWVWEGTEQPYLCCVKTALVTFTIVRYWLINCPIFMFLWDFVSFVFVSFVSFVCINLIKSDMLYLKIVFCHVNPLYFIFFTCQLKRKEVVGWWLHRCTFQVLLLLQLTPWYNHSWSSLMPCDSKYVLIEISLIASC